MYDMIALRRSLLAKLEDIVRIIESRMRELGVQKGEMHTEEQMETSAI